MSRRKSGFYLKLFASKCCYNWCSTYLVVLPPAAAQMRALCPAHPLIAHCSLPASTSTAVQQMPWPEETPVARSAGPIQHQEGATLLQSRSDQSITFIPFYPVIFLQIVEAVCMNFLLGVRSSPSLMCTLSVGMITEGYWFVVGGGVRPVLVGEASSG